MNHKSLRTGDSVTFLARSSHRNRLLTVVVATIAAVLMPPSLNMAPLASAAPQCDRDHYYDAVVNNCAMCEDVCDEKFFAAAIGFCQFNCPG